MAGAPDAEGSFDLLWRDCHMKVKRFLVRLTGDEVLAEDLLEETFLTVLDKPHEVPRDNPMPWLYGVARNHYRNDRRLAYRRRETPLEDEHVDADGHDGGMGRLEHRIDFVAFVRACRRLPDKAVLVLVLGYEHGLDDEEIARAVGTSRVNVRKIRSRAVSILQQMTPYAGATGGLRATAARG